MHMHRTIPMAEATGFVGRYPVPYRQQPGTDAGNCRAPGATADVHGAWARDRAVTDTGPGAPSDGLIVDPITPLLAMHRTLRDCYEADPLAGTDARAEHDQLHESIGLERCWRLSGGWWSGNGLVGAGGDGYMGVAARSGGRVVMQRTANPRMAVRFRPGPPINSTA
jgi:hypothetical protein